MQTLRAYRLISRFGRVSYRSKIMLVAFLGTHIPLISLAAYYGIRMSETWAEALDVLAVTLMATLVGTAMTLLVLNGLLQPILLSSSRLRAYRKARTVPDLPTEFTDEVGTLMADAQATMTHLEDALVTLETRDPGTGLPNRSAFLAQTAEDEGAVAVIRLCNHAELVALFDQDLAEGAMRALAGRLGAPGLAGPGLARVGPAEFGFILRIDIATEDGRNRAAFALRAILAAASSDLRIESSQVQPILHGGLAAIGARTTPDEALAAAISATADASESVPVVVYSEELRDAARQRFSLSQDLRRALIDDEFDLHYQPIVDLALGRVTGVEALLRWTSRERGPVSPAVFVPIAEASGLIDEIGLWVLRRACRDAVAMPGGLRVAVNLSARQFSDPDLVFHVKDALDRARLEPSRLELELTETAALADPAHTRRIMAMLRDLGVSTAIDDFGTGYASLSALRTLPFGKLKIDREFVSGVDRTPGAQAICSALVALASGLGIELLAEGAETEAEVDWLSAAGCTKFQGFHFARPMPLRDLGPAIDRLNGAAQRTDAA